MASILSDSTNSNDEQQQMMVLVQQAYRLLSQNRILQSIRLYQQIIQQNPRCWRAYQNLGVAYIMTKQYDKANTLLAKYVQHVPKDPLGHDSLGVSYSQLNDPIRAICSFVNSINLAPNYYMSYYNLGVVLGKLGLFDYALNIYLYCLELQPNYINAMNNVADIYKKQGRVNEAIEIFKEIIELDPSYSLAVKNLGNCYFSQNNYYQALITYLKTDDLYTYQQSVLFNIALCLEHYQLHSQAAHFAIKAFEKSNNINNQSISINQIFIAATFLAKQLHSIYKVIRKFLQLKKRPPERLFKRLYRLQVEVINSLSIANQYPKKYHQIEHNLQRTILNVNSYQVKMGIITISKLKQTCLLSNRNYENIISFIQQLKHFLFGISWWRKYTKKLIHQVIIHKDEKFQKQKTHLMQTFAKPFYYDLIDNKYKTRTYISRRFNHNLKRLIIKRKKFIKKYNHLNTQCNKLFKYQPLKNNLIEKSVDQSNQ